jgi:hypothetical protein
MHQLMRGPIAELFDERQLVRDVSGAGNNWAHGYCGVCECRWAGKHNQSCNLCCVFDNSSIVFFLLGRIVIHMHHTAHHSQCFAFTLSRFCISLQYITVYGEQYADSILEAVRRCAEPCDSLQVWLQCFFRSLSMLICTRNISRFFSS